MDSVSSFKQEVSMSGDDYSSHLEIEFEEYPRFATDEDHDQDSSLSTSGNTYKINFVDAQAKEVETEKELSEKCFPQQDFHIDFSDFRNKSRITESTKQQDQVGAKYYCDLCQVLFRTSDHYWTHMKKSHRRKRPYNCRKCNETFIRKSDLVTHRKIHVGEKRFQCTECGRFFSRPADLKVHERMHTGEKPYQCTLCGKCFRVSSHLKTHLQSHTNEKPYQCNLCEKWFSHTSTLRTHHKTHTGERAYPCTYCEKSFISGSDLKRHVRIHTDERPYPCIQCDRKFRLQSTLDVHLRTHRFD